MSAKQGEKVILGTVPPLEERKGRSKELPGKTLGQPRGREGEVTYRVGYVITDRNVKADVSDAFRAYYLTIPGNVYVHGDDENLVLGRETQITGRLEGVTGIAPVTKPVEINKRVEFRDRDGDVVITSNLLRKIVIEERETQSSLELLEAGGMPPEEPEIVGFEAKIAPVLGTSPAGPEATPGAMTQSV